MIKYYVTCGPLRFVCTATLPEDAASAALLELAGTKHPSLPSEIYVSEKGHEYHDDDIIFDTISAMEEAGFIFDD